MTCVEEDKLTLLKKGTRKRNVRENLDSKNAQSKDTDEQQGPTTPVFVRGS